jgi:hypothetical protein
MFEDSDPITVVLIIMAIILIGTALLYTFVPSSRPAIETIGFQQVVHSRKSLIVKTSNFFI